MKFEISPEMLEATRLTRSGKLAEAKDLLQHLLRRWSAPAGDEREPTIVDITPASMPAPRAPVPPPHGGRFLSGTHHGPDGSRDYRLYLPARLGAGPLPLVVMLHGCTQTPEDFAAGTGMNELAEEAGLIVAYPAQCARANPQRCWNWFSPNDQARGHGEPALIAGITREVMQRYPVDPKRVYVAGMSAGGAAAAIMGEAYPDLYAAVGVHSGLPAGAAHDLPSALAAMRQGHADGTRAAGRQRAPTIVFHGDRDTTVHPRNAEQVVARATDQEALAPVVEKGHAAGGHAWRRIRYVDRHGRTLHEHWTVHGAGHAWSGGKPAGSFTDALGPDASREMVRFFLTHARDEPA